MKRDFLKELELEQEAIDKIMKAYGESVNDIKEKAEKADGLESQIEDLDKQIKDRDKQLEDLSKKAKNNKELSDEIDRLKEENENAANEWQEKMEKQKKDFAIENALRDSKVKNPKVAKKSIDTENVTFKDGKLIGFDEAFEDVKEAFAFHDDEPAGLKGRQPHPTSNNPAPTNNPFGKDNFNLTEQGNLIESDPEKAKQLISQAGKNPANFGL